MWLLGSFSRSFFFSSVLLSWFFEIIPENTSLEQSPGFFYGLEALQRLMDPLKASREW